MFKTLLSVQSKRDWSAYIRIPNFILIRDKRGRWRESTLFLLSLFIEMFQFGSVYNRNGFFSAILTIYQRLLYTGRLSVFFTFDD